ncbi:unnamed protein product [Dracunculus medinensis]|uniref:Two-component sensor histidine kinase n=1 Tax=Dracunculus medinensis TaxID=318479 RepID=A0A0N4U350_DRAME|nr:unnamed protein product [Dracunculus medinensis]
MELLIKKIKLAKRLFVLRKLGRCKILLVIATLFVYILLGSSTIFFFESNAHESYVRKIYLNIAVNRRMFARKMSRQIFNDTKYLLIVIDQEQTERVQAHLVNALKDYESLLNLKIPDKREWDLINSVNYILSLLITIGSSDLMPRTKSGQVRAL